MRSLSNLIKSGRVINADVPVNVGLNSVSNNFSRVIREKKKVEPQEIEVQESVETEVEEPIKSKEEIIAEYMAEAKKKADAEYAEIVNRAREEGVMAAQAEAENIIKKAQEDYQSVLDEIVRLKEEAILEYKNEMSSLEKDVLDLAFSITEKIINYEVNRSDEYVLGIVKDALDKVLNKKDVILKLSTADYYTILSNKKYLVANVKGFGEIEIVQDESMEPGSCIVDTPLGVIDGSLQIRMDNIQKEVAKILAG